MVSGVHSRSWNVSPIDKGGLLYSPRARQSLPSRAREDGGLRWLFKEILSCFLCWPHLCCSLSTSHICSGQECVNRGWIQASRSLGRHEVQTELRGRCSPQLKAPHSTACGGPRHLTPFQATIRPDQQASVAGLWEVVGSVSWIKDSLIRELPP